MKIQLITFKEPLIRRLVRHGEIELVMNERHVKTEDLL